MKTENYVDRMTYFKDIVDDDRADLVYYSDYSAAELTKAIDEAIKLRYDADEQKESKISLKKYKKKIKKLEAKVQKLKGYIRELEERSEDEEMQHDY